MILDPVSFDQLARDHNIQNVDEWKNLYASKKFDELQTRLNRFNKDLVTECIQERQPDFTVQENEDVFDVLKREDVSFDCLSDVGLYCLLDSLHASFNFQIQLITNAPTYKVDWLPYLACLKRYELISMLLERQGHMKLKHTGYGLLIGKFLSDACLDDTDNSLNNLVGSLIRKRQIDTFIVHFMVRNSEFAVSHGYIRNYIHWLCVIKQTDENSEWRSMCHVSIVALFERNQADKLRVLLNEMTEQHLLSVEQLNELMTSREISFSGVSLFERCMIFCEKETCSVILGLLKKEDVSELLTQGRGQWLLTDMVIKERQDVIETVLEYGLNLTDNEKDEFHSQLVKGSLSQNMILLLKELASAYIIPEGTDKARKQALVYYNVKGREDLGEEEAQALIAGLDSLDFQVQTRQDWKVDTLERDMKKDIEQVKDNCSVLVVFMMAHGSAEEICDADKKPVAHGYVDDIINSVVSGIPKGIPKISIIDACRERKAEPGMLERVTQITSTVKQVKDSINPQDYCRFMTAAKDEVTYRNVMLPILMEEWEKAGEFTEIMNRVRRAMKEHPVPKYRTTLTEEARSLDRKLYM